MSSRPRLRLFLDSNVVTGGIVSPWGLDKAVLSLCAARVCRLVLAEAVREEVEENLLHHLAGVEPSVVNRILGDYSRLIKLTQPEVIPWPPETDVIANRHLIRHAPDVPILLSAITSQPDWLLTRNTKHFSPAVAARTGLRIATPVQFLRTLASRISGPH